MKEGESPPKRKRGRPRKSEQIIVPLPREEDYDSIINDERRNELKKEKEEDVEEDEEENAEESDENLLDEEPSTDEDDDEEGGIVQGVGYVGVECDVGESDVETGRAAVAPFAENIKDEDVGLDSNGEEKVRIGDEAAKQNSTPTKKLRRGRKTDTNRTMGTFEEMFFQLVLYRARVGDCLVPTSFRDQRNLGRWIHTVRQQYKEDMLSIDQIIALESIGHIWDVKESQWDDRYKELLRFKEQNGHCMVPTAKSDLGAWVNSQRCAYASHIRGKALANKNPENPAASRKIRSISDERVAKLNAIGFVWKLKDRNNWDKRLAELKQFVQQNGHARVPQHYKENRKLGKWVAKQRYELTLIKTGKPSQLTKERMNQLDALGFSWGSNNKKSQPAIERHSMEQQQLVFDQDKPIQDSDDIDDDEDVTSEVAIRTNNNDIPKNHDIVDNDAVMVSNGVINDKPAFDHTQINASGNMHGVKVSDLPLTPVDAVAMENTIVTQETIAHATQGAVPSAFLAAPEITDRLHHQSNENNIGDVDLEREQHAYTTHLAANNTGENDPMSATGVNIHVGEGGGMGHDPHFFTSGMPSGQIYQQQHHFHPQPPQQQQQHQHLQHPGQLGMGQDNGVTPPHMQPNQGVRGFHFHHT